MRAFSAGINLIVVGVLLSGCRPSSSTWRIDATKAGAVRFGMSPEEAAAALGAPLDDSFPAQGCDYWSPASVPRGLRFMIEDRRVVRVDVDSVGPATPEGITVGSPISQVRAAYGSRLREEPHKYQWESGWRYLTLVADDSARALVFEVDSFVVRSYRAGLLPPVTYVEHCS